MPLGRIGFRKVADDLGASLDFADRIRNRYKSFGADALLQFIELRRMLRASGTEAPGARRCGQAEAYDGLRARVVAGRLCDSPGCAESANP